MCVDVYILNIKDVSAIEYLSFIRILFFIEINEWYMYSLNQGATHHVSG